MVSKGGKQSNRKILKSPLIDLETQAARLVTLSPTEGSEEEVVGDAVDVWYVDLDLGHAMEPKGDVDEERDVICMGREPLQVLDEDDRGAERS